MRDSALPEPAKELIIRVVGRTRLWRRERAEVAAELLAHFADGLDAGRSMDDLLATFGNQRQTAKLIRRGKRRNRPLWWHVQRRLGQAIVIFAGVYVLLGIGMMFTHPSPSVDYLAQLNATAKSVKPEDSAWPIYRDAWLNNGKWSNGTMAFDVDLEVKDADGQLLGRDVGPDDPGWPAVVEFLHNHRPLLDALRSAADKPKFGLVLQNDPTISLNVIGECCSLEAGLPNLPLRVASIRFLIDRWHVCFCRT